MHLFYYRCSLKSSKHFSVRYNSATFFALIAFVYKFFISTFLGENTLENCAVDENTKIRH